MLLVEKCALRINDNGYSFAPTVMYFQLGVAVLCIPKPKLLKEMGIRTHDIYGRMLEGRSWSEHKNEEDQEEDEEEEDSLNWTGSIKIDAIIYPTMEGTLDIDQEGPVYILDATLSLPSGNATVNDVFEFIVNTWPHH